MMQRVWPDTAVEESNLARNVSTLKRRSLGQETDEHRCIETIPWRGYRFTAQTRELCDVSGTIDSLAVLPFINESTDPATEYLARRLHRKPDPQTLASGRPESDVTSFRIPVQDKDAKASVPEAEPSAGNLAFVLY